MRISLAIPFWRTFLSVIGIGLFFCSNAQLCPGSLGDPAVNINFGSGSNNTGYTPSDAYTLTNSECPNDGFYTITNYTSGCFNNTWHAVTKDHTGGGAFMLVNASFTPGDFFVATVSNLCANTSYEFAAWIMNVLSINGIRPNITFSIEAPGGAVLQQFSTGDIPETPTPQWVQYGFYFTTPVDNAVVILRMTNNAPGGRGNDLALDDITFRPCGPIVTSEIQGHSDTVDICEGNESIFSLTGSASDEYVSPVYQWQASLDSGKNWADIPGAATASYIRQPTDTGTFWYRLTVVEASSASIKSCRISSHSLIINVHPNPSISAGPDRVNLAGESIVLDGTVAGENPTHSWDPPDHLDDIHQLDPVASPVSDITYTLLAESAYGCKSKDSVSVRVVAGIFVPTAFTPNNDGKNDNWRIPFLDPLFGGVVNVYNRTGRLVYQADAVKVDWDGTYKGMPQASGVYVYYIRFKTGRREMKGILTLIR